jgi:hypothetical protein
MNLLKIINWNAEWPAIKYKKKKEKKILLVKDRRKGGDLNALAS